MKKYISMENIRIKNCATTDYRFVHRLSKRNMEEYVKKYWGKWDSRKFKDNFKKENIKIINYNKRKIGFFEVTRKGSMETRRAVLFIALPSDMKTETKDFPCTTSLQFLIRKNRLYLIANMRSNDLVLGFTYDAASFTLFQEKMLLELRQHYPKLKMGKYIHIAASIHIYKKHYEMIKSVLKDKNKNLKISIPKMDDLKERLLSTIKYRNDAWKEHLYSRGNEDEIVAYYLKWQKGFLNYADKFRDSIDTLIVEIKEVDYKKYSDHIFNHCFN